MIYSNRLVESLPPWKEQIYLQLPFFISKYNFLMQLYDKLMLPPVILPALSIIKKIITSYWILKRIFANIFYMLDGSNVFFNLIIPVYPNLFASVAVPLYPIRHSEIPFILAYFVKVLNFIVLVIVLLLYNCGVVGVLRWSRNVNLTFCFKCSTYPSGNKGVMLLI